MQISSEIGSSNPLMPIDTLAISKKLQASGMPAKQAEAQAEVFGAIVTQHLASKEDVEVLRKDTTSGIEGLSKDTTMLIENLRKDTTTAIESLRKDTTTAIESLRKDTTTAIESLRKDTTTAIESLRKELLIEMRNITISMMKWIIPLMAGQLAATAGLFKMFSN